jgi:hypothetical protein
MRALLILSLFFFPLSALQAQVIDTSELDKLQKGEYTLAEGQLQVLFDDTTTQSYIEKEFLKSGLEIKSLDFNNVILTLGSHPEKNQLRSLQGEASVKAVINESSYLLTDNDERKPFDDLGFQNIDPEDISEFQFKDAYQFVFVILDDNANMKSANKIIADYPELKLSVLSEGRRSAVVLTSPNNEEEVISLLESKPFVQSVAYMGVIE